MLNFPWLFKFRLDLPVAAVTPIILMKLTVHLCLTIRMRIVFVNIQICDPNGSYFND